MTTTFEGANVGDKVYSPAFGWGEISYIYTSKKYPLSIKFYDDLDEDYGFTFEGYYFKDVPRQSLFWDEVTIEVPVKQEVINAAKVPIKPCYIEINFSIPTK
jgi:hypothetical protein